MREYCPEALTVRTEGSEARSEKTGCGPEQAWLIRNLLHD